MSDTMKKRSIKLNPVLTADDANALCLRMADTNGIVDMSWEQPDRLKVQYELMNINLVEIEKKINECGGHLASGFFNRFIRGWIHFTEENETQNLRSVPRSCCSIPESKQ